MLSAGGRVEPKGVRLLFQIYWVKTTELPQTEYEYIDHWFDLNISNKRRPGFESRQIDVVSPFVLPQVEKGNQVERTTI